MKRSVVISAAILSIALVAAVWIGGSYLLKTKGHEKTVSVVGLAEREFVSDLIVWDLNYNVLDMNLKQGYNQLRTKQQVVKEYLLSKGISEEEMDFHSIDSYQETEYRYDPETRSSRSVFIGHKLSQRVRIQSGDVDKVEKISREISELIDKDIDVSSDISFYYTKLADLKIEMLNEATADARNRAETIAKSAGSRLGGLKTANMGVFQITAPNSSDESYSWGGAFNTSSKQKKASINMRLTYYVK